jgi:hypothetical protein
MEAAERERKVRRVLERMKYEDVRMLSFVYGPEGLKQIKPWGPLTPLIPLTKGALKNLGGVVWLMEISWAAQRGDLDAARIARGLRIEAEAMLNGAIRSYEKERGTLHGDTE